MVLTGFYRLSVSHSGAHLIGSHTNKNGHKPVSRQGENHTTHTQGREGGEPDQSDNTQTHTPSRV